MSKNFDYSLKDISSNLEKSLKEAELLGEGHNGVVFLLKNNKAIKIFRRMSVWKDESSILKRVRKSRFFPRIYEAKPGYIIREYVDGVRLDKYLRRGNLDEELCKELYLMILEFERLGFKRIDIRCKDIYIHLFKGLFKRDELNRFLNYVAEIDEKRAHIWREKFEIYAEDKNLLI